MAFGSTAGAVLEPFVSWRGLFVLVALFSTVVFAMLLPFHSLLAGRPQGHTAMSFGTILDAYGQLLLSKRGSRTYAYVLFNAIFHSGIFTWLGVYFASRYSLNEVQIGLALLGYGLPGFLFGPLIGRLADR